VPDLYDEKVPKAMLGFIALAFVGFKEAAA
jgi:hypothetical protein